jgi:cobalt-zinc-cadmium efflux system outer membrane protein
LCLLSVEYSRAQPDTLLLSRVQAESLFLENNVDLLINQLNIDHADAEILQAKLWPNPTLSIAEINLWNTGKEHSEDLPPLFGNWGKTTQVSAQFEQLIYTASKKSKLVSIKKVDREIASTYFEELLRNLKYEFRNSLTELQFLQQKEKLYKNLTANLERLISGFKNQLQQKNISKSELVRLQFLKIQFQKQINEIHKNRNVLVKELKLLMAQSPETFIVLTDEGFEMNLQQVEKLNHPELIQIAFENRSDLKINRLEAKYFQKRLDYEKVMRIPDLTLGVSYDRGGGIMRDFVGFGVSFDLPFFNRNQGAIQQAQIEIVQNEILLQQKEREIGSELMLQLENLNRNLEMLSNFEPGFENDIDSLMQAHHQNFIVKNIGLIEYIDFTESYIESKEALLEIQKKLLVQFEEIQYVVGKEL